jgi:mannose-6-phosphate isomerase-like protein (cupin superfamily)
MPDTKRLYTSVEDITPEETSHGNTLKRVLKRNEELSNSMTQIAVGCFQPGESCPTHQHESMFEYFYITSGTGTYVIENERIPLKPKMLIEIPPKTPHRLIADPGEPLKFIYWGVSTDSDD